MITQLKIENYKSIQDLTLDVGRVNVLIGENGCGKSNILEAITLAAAAEANKLDNEFLVNRGIRVTEPQLMRSAFDKENCDKEIKVMINTVLYTLQHDNKIYSEWKWKEFERNYSKSLATTYKNFAEFESFPELKTFVIYSPENTSLRNLEKEGQIQPLGIHGEGLLKLLIVTQYEAKNSEQLNQESERFNDIQKILELIDWYDYIKIPNEYPLLEDKLIIKDRYLGREFDTQSVNEGFLFLLFYAVLTVSRYTPKIFAIDNIDTSLNPKLCTKLIKELARLAKKYDKQIFLTSHNPAILDGIDLSDEEQRLFVVSRNREGHTRCKRLDINAKPKSSVRDRLSRILDDNKTYNKAEILELFDNSQEPIKLSEALLRGYLGGLPKGF